MAFTNKTSKIPWNLKVIFWCLSARILILGYWYYANQAAHFRREMEAQLNAIADLKVKQIVDWRQERMHDAILMFDDPIFASELQEWLDGKAPPGQQEEIVHRLLGLKQDMYVGIRLLDAQRRVLFAIPETVPGMTPLIKGMVDEALSGGRVIFSDFHHNLEKEIRLDIVIPLHYHQAGREIYNGVIILCVDPYTLLYPLIDSWPTPSPTGEFTLVRREGDDLVYLNDLRHRKDSALTLRLPLTEKLVPAVNAALGKKEIMQGIDYRSLGLNARTCLIIWET